MRNTRLIYILIIINSFASCAQAKLQNYQCIETFLKTKNIDSKKSGMLIKEKDNYNGALRIFYGGDENSDYTNNYRSPLFEEQEWEKMYKSYKTDTTVKYWRKEDFPNFNFTFQDRKGLWNFAFFDKFENDQMNVYFISEPMFYNKGKYVIFEFSEGITGTSGIQRNQIVIMTNENDNWKVVETIYDYVLH